VKSGGGRRSEAKRREILSAARALFMSEGYDETGMEAVARQACVSTATLYAHFAGKAELFRAMVDEMIADTGEDVRRGAQAPGGARGRLTSFAVAYARFCASPVARGTIRVVCSQRRRFEDSARAAEGRAHELIGGVAIKLVEDLAREGAIAVDKSCWAASQLLGMIEHPTLIYGLVRGDEAQPQRSIEAICEDAVTTFLTRYGVREKAG
jgi:AcrR family transcriptional regulator